MEAPWAPVASVKFKSFERTTLFIRENRLLQRINKPDSDEAGQVSPVENVEEIDMRSVASGCGYAVAISRDGEVFTWGDGTGGRLGHGDTNYETRPKIVRSLAAIHVVAVAASQHHCLAVSHNGSVYSWGWNNWGQCGIGHASAAVLHPVEVILPTCVEARTASASERTSLIVTRDGKLFSFGDNRFGQLGLGDATIPRSVCVDYVTSPTRVILRDEGQEQEELVRGVACGLFHSLAVTESGKVFSWGSNSGNRLGYRRVRSHSEDPIRIRGDLENQRVRSVTAENNRSGAVTETGSVYTWGSSKAYGGLGYTELEIIEPKQVRGEQCLLWNEKAIAVSMHVDNSILVVTNTGSVYGQGACYWSDGTDCGTHRAQVLVGVRVDVNERD